MEQKAIVEIPVEHIKQVMNSRSEYRDVELAELMSSMRANGLLQPIGLRAVGAKEFHVVWGNRRLTAAIKLGWRTVPCVMADAETDEDFIVQNATENMSRSSVTLSDLGRQFDKLLKMGLTIDEISARIGTSRQQVHRSLELFRAVPKKYHEKISPITMMPGQKPKNGMITMQAAARISDMIKNYEIPKDQAEQIFDLATKDRLSSTTIAAVTKLMAQGYEVQDAVKKLDELHSCVVPVLLTKKEMERIESTYKMGVVKFLGEILKADPRIKILKAGNYGGGSDRVIVRKKSKSK
jgi:ParB/RepB/Spo0J family partition protein